MSIRPISTVVLESPCYFQRKYKNGSISESTTYGTSDISEDHPIAGADGDFKATTAYEIRLRKLMYPSGVWKGFKNNGWYEAYTGNLYAVGLGAPGSFGVIPPVSEMTSLTSAVKIACVEKLRQQAANFLVFYAERMEAGTLVLGIIGSIVGALRKLRGVLIQACVKQALKQHADGFITLGKKSLKDLRRKLREAPLALLISRLGNWATNLWLQYVFGIRPLVDEIAGVVNAVKEPKRQSVKVVATRTNRRNQQVTATGSIGPGATFHWTGTKKSVQSIRGTLKAEVVLPGLAAASELGLTNPFSAAWEVIPFSWVIDVLWPLGGWLNSFDATLGWQIESSSCVTAFAKSEGVYNAYGKASVSWVDAGGYAQCSEEVKHFTRARWDDSIPLPRLRPPSTIALVQTFANLMSILVQAINGGPSKTLRI